MGIMVDNSAQNKDLEGLMAMGAKYFGVDTPIVAVREEGSEMIFTLLGGKQLRCKFHDLMSGEVKTTETQRTQRKARANKQK
jgi:hypothetical protein